MKQQWVRFEDAGKAAFGTVQGDAVHEHQGDMYGRSEPTGRVFVLAGLKLLTPSEPTKVIALWNNFHALGAKLSLPVPAEPLYLLKAPNSFAAHGDAIRKPLCEGKVVFEGELGIVIGKTATAVAEPMRWTTCSATPAPTT
jgi:2-keto-4-pentenoate hydratase/2-oxohepta-3-ene-1,7-dioic acid hydratase in catechol pathway